MSQQPEAIRLAEWLKAHFIAGHINGAQAANELIRLHADNKRAATLLVEHAQALTTLRAQVERLQAAGQVAPLGYINAGHLHEMRQGRLPHAYLYPTEGVGASVPVYTTPAQEAADTGADERAQFLAWHLSTHGRDADMAQPKDWNRWDAWRARAALAARAGQVAAPAMVPLAEKTVGAPFVLPEYLRQTWAVSLAGPGNGSMASRLSLVDQLVVGSRPQTEGRQHG